MNTGIHTHKHTDTNKRRILLSRTTTAPFNVSLLSSLPSGSLFARTSGPFNRTILYIQYMVYVHGAHFSSCTIFFAAPFVCCVLVCKCVLCVVPVRLSACRACSGVREKCVQQDSTVNSTRLDTTHDNRHAGRTHTRLERMNAMRQMRANANKQSVGAKCEHDTAAAMPSCPLSFCMCFAGTDSRIANGGKRGKGADVIQNCLCSRVFNDAHDG